MRAIGLAFQKGRMRLTALDKNVDDIAFFKAQAVTIDPDLSLPELMERYATQIRMLLDEYCPDVVAVKQVWESKNVAAATCQIAPVGILAYVCHERSIEFTAYTPQALRQPKPFSLPAGSNPLDAIDAKFGAHFWTANEA